MNPLRMAGWGSDGRSHPGEGTEQGPAVSRRIYMVPSKRLQNQIIKGLLQINHQSSKWRWLVLNVEFEVFSFDINASLR